MKPTRYIIAAFAAFCAAHAAWAAILDAPVWKGTVADSEKYYWEESGNWTTARRDYGGIHFEISGDGLGTDSGSRTIWFRANPTAASWLSFKNGLEEPIVFRADSPTDGLVHNNDVVYIGHNPAGSLTIESGTHTFLNTKIGVGAEGRLDIAGGSLVVGDLNVGDTAKGALAVDGGVLSCGTATSEKWLRIGQEGSSIAIGEGGRLEAWHIEATSDANCSLTLDGGTLASFGTGTKYCQYLIGNYESNVYDSKLSVTVTAKGGILDTQGKTVNIKNVAIGGEGTLRIVGGGTATFEAKPTCPVNVEDGVLVGNEYLPANLTFGTNGFVKFDLSAIAQEVTDNGDGTSTTNAPGAAQTLASGVTIAVPAGDTAAEHVIVKNDGTLAWTVAYSASTLTATAQLASEAVPTMTVWTGDYSEAYAPRSNNSETKWGSVKNWTSGAPGATTKIIIPGNEAIYLDVNNGRTQCGDVQLRSSGTTVFFARNSKNFPGQTFAPQSVGGSGTMAIGGMNLDIATAGPACTIDVPLEIVHTNRYNGSNWYDFTVNLLANSATYPLTLNNTVTVPEDVPLTIGANVIINGDMVIDGTTTFSTTQEIKAGLSGSGVINGNFTTAAGAKVCATVTSAEGETSYLTVNGAADLSNATVEVAGGELLAGADYDDEIILLRATDTITWTKTSYVIPGQDKAWTIKTDTKSYDEDDGNGGTTQVAYNVLKAVKARPGLMIIISGTPTGNRPRA